MKINYKTLILCIAIPLAVGGLAGLLTSNSMETFAMLNKPALSPPGFLFPIVWTILHVLMGIASYLVVTSNATPKQILSALTYYGIQLAINFFWSIFFFNFEWYLFSFLWLLFLWVMIVNTIISFYEISELSAYLLVPYLLWVTFAGYLNLSIYLLN